MMKTWQFILCARFVSSFSVQHCSHPSTTAHRLQNHRIPNLRNFVSCQQTTEGKLVSEMQHSLLLETCKKACDCMSPLIRDLYRAMNDETSKLKADKSVFTITDGIVQSLLSDHLFSGGKFLSVVGEEEESFVNLIDRPYTVEKMKIPEEFFGHIDSVVAEIENLATKIDDKKFRDQTVFIDPIDGTREFASGQGEQCSICIGFASSEGKPVSGLVYRPLSEPITFAGGCSEENFIFSELDIVPAPSTDGFLTTNGAISPFTEHLIAELGHQRVRSGGAGNKMLMLLEGKGAVYLQDRGVCRWDTCAAQAVLEAHGGALSKLTSFARDGTLESYHYARSTLNADFLPGVARLTPHNCAAGLRERVRAQGDGGGEPETSSSAEQVAPYANLCGLVALSPAGVAGRLGLLEAVRGAAARCPPRYE